MTRKLRKLWMALLLAAAPEARTALRVVATTPDYGALAGAIGGDRVSLSVLAKPTEDPHFVDARPSHIVTLNRADVLIESGAGLEIGWLPALITGARNAKIQAGAVGHVLGAEGIRLFDVPAVLDRSRGDVHAAGNPHFLMDPLNAGAIARRLADVFCQLDVQGCPTFRENLARFEATLDEKMRIWAGRLAPHQGASIVTYHNTWRYFAERFQLRAETFLEPKPGIPPSPPHLARVIEQMKTGRMKIILVEPFQSRKTAETVAGHVGARVVDVCQFPGGLQGTDGDYFALMEANVNAVTSTLGATSAR